MAATGTFVPRTYGNFCSPSAFLKGELTLVKELILRQNFFIIK